MTGDHPNTREAPTTERKLNRYVVGLSGTAFIGMCEVGHPGCFGARGAEYVMACDHEREIERLRAALVHSVSVIQTWHNMEIPVKQRSDLWDIYWRNAPEMKQIREALRGDAT